MDHAEVSAPAGVEKVTPPAEHTPGPWRLNDDIHAHVLSGDYHAIDGGAGYHPNGFGVCGYMSLANARLIAAAPDLLEALEAFVEEVAGTFPFASLPPAKAAIAKARGAPPDT